MAQKIAIGIQDFEELRKENYFYVDKTAFYFVVLCKGKGYKTGRCQKADQEHY